jgi:hypothetical protein
MSQTRNLIQTLVSGIAPATRSRATPQALVLDTLCLLLDVLAPRLRPVSARHSGQGRASGQVALVLLSLLAFAHLPAGEHTAVQCPREAATVQSCGYHVGLQPHLSPRAHTRWAVPLQAGAVSAPSTQGKGGLGGGLYCGCQSQHGLGKVSRGGQFQLSSQPGMTEEGAPHPQVTQSCPTSAGWPHA